MLAQLAVGVVVSRSIATEDDYLVAGRSLGPVLTAFTVFATWFGAETCIGAAGAVYAVGLSGGSADPFGYGICVIVTGLVFAIPLWRLKLTTLADLFRIRFSASVERLAVVLMVPTSLLWAAAQIRAFGQVLSTASGLDVEITITIAALVVIAYTTFGGLLADAWTDLIQGIALIIGLGILFIVVLGREGLTPLSALGPGALNPLGSEPRPLLAIVEEWAIPVVGSMVAAELVARLVATRTPQIARDATVVAGASYLVIGSIPVVLGLMGAVLLPGIAEPEQILPLLAQRYLPTFLYVLFAGALVSAILSTVDSALLVASSLVSHNLIIPLRGQVSERGKVLIARSGVVVFGILAYVMAMRAEAAYLLIEEASAFGSAGIVTIVTFGLFTRIGGTASALGALVTGAVMWVLGAHMLALDYPYLVALATSVGAYLAIAAAGSRPLRELAPIAGCVLLVSTLFGCGAPDPGSSESPGAAGAGDGADLVLRGGRVHTFDEARPMAQAVAVDDGRIVFVGDDAGAEAWLGADTEVIRLEGRALLPGFIDSHVHPLTGGLELGDCDLNAAATRADVIRTVAECAARDPDAPWVRGGGWQLPLFAGAAPSRRLLDSLVSDRPAYLTSADGHSAWANTRALELAAIDAATPDPPPDGVILRDPDGRPQGTLRESAMQLVARRIPERTDAEMEEGLARGLAMAASLGITTLHEASADEPILRAYRALEDRGRLTARAIVALRVDPAGGVAQVAELAALRDRYAGPHVLPVAAKIFEDGVIEAGTAALLADYTDRPGWRGELVFPPDTLRAVMAGLGAAGFKIHIHAIGDRAIRASLDAIEASGVGAGPDAVGDPRGPRPIIAHIQLWDPADIPRFARLGVVASFQPLWAYEDSYIADLTEPRLGPERSRWLYPIRSVVASGAIVAGGSDWSVTSMNPLEAIEVGITRRDPGLDDGPSWIPEERVDLETMLRAYTVAGALASDLEDEIGRLAVGMRADLVALERDPFEVPTTGLSELRVDLTVFDGRVVYRRNR